MFVRLRELIPNSKSVAVFEIQNRLKRSFEGKYSRQCLCTALSVFEELNILYRFNRNGVDYYQRKVINKNLIYYHRLFIENIENKELGLRE